MNVIKEIQDIIDLMQAELEVLEEAHGLIAKPTYEIALLRMQIQNLKMLLHKLKEVARNE